MNPSNNLRLIHPDEIDTILPINVHSSDNYYSAPKCSLPAVLPPNFVDYDKYYNKYCNKNSETYENSTDKINDVKLPIISEFKEDYKFPSTSSINEENTSKIFYKRTELRPIEKSVPLPKVGQIGTYGKMKFVYSGGF